MLKLKKLGSIFALLLLTFSTIVPVVHADVTPAPASLCSPSSLDSCTTIDCTPQFTAAKVALCTALAKALGTQFNIPQKHYTVFESEKNYGGGAESMFGSDGKVYGLDTTSVLMNTYLPATASFSIPKSELLYADFTGKFDDYRPGENLRPGGVLLTGDTGNASYVFSSTKADTKRTHDYIKGCLLMRNVSDGELLRAQANSAASTTVTLNEPLAKSQDGNITRGYFAPGGKLKFDSNNRNPNYSYVLSSFYQPGETILPVAQDDINTSFESSGTSSDPLVVVDKMKYFLGGTKGEVDKNNNPTNSDANRIVTWKDDNTVIARSHPYSYLNSLNASICVYDASNDIYKWDDSNTKLNFTTITPCIYGHNTNTSTNDKNTKNLTGVGQSATWICKGCTPAFGTDKDLFNNQVDGVNTAIGCFPTSINGIVSAAIRIGIGVAGALAFVRIALALIKLMTDGANPETVKTSQGAIASSIIGLLVIIFSVFLLNLIGVQILALNVNDGGNTIETITYNKTKP